MSEQSEVSEKPKLSEARLAALQKAREKALEKKKEMSEITSKEKAVKELEFQKRKKEVEIKLNRITSQNDEEEAQVKPKVIKPKKKKPQKLPETESEESESSSSESSDDEVIKKIKAKRTVVKKVEKRPTAQLAAEVTKEELMRRIQKQNLSSAYQSLGFGNLFS